MLNLEMSCLRKVSLAVGLLLGFSLEALAAKGNELIYQEPFDLAAGGASLTRASQEGIVFANPALLPLGGAGIRWLGAQLGVMADQKLSRKLITKDGLGSDDMTEVLLNNSYHVGQSFSLAFLNEYFAVSLFDRIELDYEGQKFGDYGLPAINIGVEAYGGGLVSAAARPYSWLCLGITGKYLFAGEPNILIPLTDQEELFGILSNPMSLKDEIHYGKGLGMDLGGLIFLQGRHVDLNVAWKIDDIGDTQLGRANSFKQTVSAGFGIAFHGTTEVLHLAADYRDILDVYEERTFKKVYVGARLLIRQMLGLAAGYYQGIPTAGIKLNLYLLKIGLTAYGRELGQYPGDRQRNLYYGYLAAGW